MKRWESMKVAFVGVPEQEIASHKNVKDACMRCGRVGYRCISCYARTTIAGTPRQEVPIRDMKRKHDGIDSTTPPNKISKAAALSAEDAKEGLAIWELDSDNDDC